MIQQEKTDREWSLAEKSESKSEPRDDWEAVMGEADKMLLGRNQCLVPCVAMASNIKRKWLPPWTRALSVQAKDVALFQSLLQAWNFELG